MRWLWIALLSFSLSASAFFSQKVKVLERANLGSMTEDITFVTNGPYAGHIALLDGYEVLGIAAEGRASQPSRSYSICATCPWDQLRKAWPTLRPRSCSCLMRKIVREENTASLLAELLST